MTEKQKRFAIIGGTVLVAVLLLLMFRKGNGGAAATVGGNAMLPAVTGPSLGPIYIGGSTPSFVIPGLDLSGPNLNMIGACCSDCMQAQTGFNNPTWSGPNVTINQGNSGPNVYNYNNNVGDGYGGLGGAIYDPSTGTYQRAS